MSNNNTVLQNQFVESILRRKAANWRSKASLNRFLSNVCIGLSFYLDLRFHFLSRYLFITDPIDFYIDLIFIGYFALMAIINMCIYISQFLNPEVIEIEPNQQKLFGIKNSDVGFKLPTPKKISPKQNTSFSSNCILPSHQTSNNMSSMLSQNSLDMTPLNWSHQSSNYSMSSPSWVYNNGNNNNTSPGSFVTTPQDSFLKRRFQNNQTSPTTPTQSPPGYFSPNESLSMWNKSNMSMPSSPENGSFWNSPKQMMNYPMLGNSPYQIATRSCEMSTLSNGPESPNLYSMEVILSYLRVKDDQLTNYIENLRRWIHKTIMVPLANEINKINTALTEMGTPECHIGEASLPAMKQLAITKMLSIPNIMALVPYLELTTNQEYLVYRLKELAKGGCISEFKWNSGGRFRGKPWTEDVPTDSAILLHVFSVYMDSRLPADPQFPGGKTFSTQFIKEKDKKLPLSKDLYYIYQSQISPPHYQVVLGETLLDIPKGRNNLFCTLIVFIKYIKDAHAGMLARVNLGPSGINVLCVLD